MEVLEEGWVEALEGERRGGVQRGGARGERRGEVQR